MRTGTLILISAMFVASGFARETVYLNSGFTVSADSHVETDGVYVLHIGNGTVEYPADQIRAIVAIADAPVIHNPEPSPAPQDSRDILNAAAHAEGVDAILVHAVAKVESGLRQQAISSKGALGLMQLMPYTAATLGVDPRNAGQNASGGARYLRGLLERYHYNPVLALAAYNAGPGAVAKYGGMPPYYETRVYVVRVLKEYERELRAAGIQPEWTGRSHAGRLATSVAALSSTPSATN